MPAVLPARWLSRTWMFDAPVPVAAMPRAPPVMALCSTTAFAVPPASVRPVAAPDTSITLWTIWAPEPPSRVRPAPLRVVPISVMLAPPVTLAPALMMRFASVAPAGSALLTATAPWIVLTPSGEPRINTPASVVVSVNPPA